MDVGPNMSIETRASLLLRLRDHADGAAWSDFVSIYEPVIYRLARTRGLQDADAREVTQDVLLAVAGAIERFDVQRKTRFGHWLARITRNAAIDLIRKRREQGTGRTDVIRSLEQHPEPESDESAVFEIERRRQLFRWAARQIRGRVQPSSWQAFWSTAVELKRASVVAEELGMTEGAVYVARCRVLARLRELVAESDE